MRVRKLRVFRYRNFSKAEIFFSPATNILLGRNAQGKTNLLEAAYLLGYGKSFRNIAPKECIQHGQVESLVEGVIERGSLEKHIQVLISPSEKKLLVHGKQVSLDEFVGNFHVLAFSSDHLKVIRGGPIERRGFLDRAMITIYPGHVRDLVTYGRALRQRNRLISLARERRETIEESLIESWDEKLVQEGSAILWRRKSYVEEMSKELLAGLFGKEVLKIKYLSTVPTESNDLAAIREEFRRSLQGRRDLDRGIGFTTIGPHRDELKVFVNGKSLANFGSAGQQRSSLLALYFAQMEIHHRFHGFYPVFLMDDVEAELDSERLKIFLSYLSRRTQTFLTTAKYSLLMPPECEIQRFEVIDGAVRPL